jgi:GTPase SAR1 family protein
MGKRKLSICLIDTPSETRANELFLREADAVVVVYDLTQQKSYERAKVWLEWLQENSKRVPAMLLGNKRDLSVLQTISTAKADALARRYDLLYQEI